MAVGHEQRHAFAARPFRFVHRAVRLSEERVGVDGLFGPSDADTCPQLDYTGADVDRGLRRRRDTFSNSRLLEPSFRLAGR